MQKSSRSTTGIQRAFRTFAILLAAGWIPCATVRADTVSNSDCFACHDDASLTKTVNGKAVSMTVKPDALKGSVHATLSCTDCHSGIKELPHEGKVTTATCDSCHEVEAKEYATSIHGVNRSRGGEDAASCSDCHGSHNILPVKHGDSPVFKMNLPQTCSRCHNNPALTAEYRMKYPEVSAQYTESIHGRALLQLGLIVAPSCNDCHGVHNIMRSTDRQSPINHANVADTCGKCHVGIEKIYAESVHGELLAKGDKRGPVCTDCHSAHQIESPVGGHFKSISDARCGKCHEDRLEYYMETYHGKAMALGQANKAPEVAACYDCHGHHDVLPPSDPKSRLSSTHILGTCQKCHPKATPKFTEYVPHANPLDKANYPMLHLVMVLMTALLVGTFAFFGFHTVLWIFRSAYLYMHDSKTFREARVHAETDTEWFTRFTPYERLLHVLVVTSFLLLVLTGMPLKFHYTAWAKTVFNIMGGPQVARTLHHFAAIITLIYFTLHLVERGIAVCRGWGNVRNPETGRFDWKRAWKIMIGPDSMVPTKRDWDDFIAHQKWFFGKGPKPQFDRWTYWERFDYLAVFWGVAMIGASGLIMWFPEWFTRYMPGWVINIALIVHSDEALLAAGFIFTFHFFNTHFRLEKFPMDTVIFSGRISKSEMLHERKQWYDRLAAEGRLDDHRLKDEWARWKNIAKSFGYAFFGTGVILLILIIMAMAARLIH